MGIRLGTGAVAMMACDGLHFARSRCARGRDGGRKACCARAALTVPVALGRGGVRADKREGDGATPAGVFQPLRVWWRADRLPRPRTGLPLRRIGRSTPGAKTRPTGATTALSSVRPMNQATGLARRRALRPVRRDRPQYAAPHRRPWQRGLYPRGTAGFRADGRMRRAAAGRSEASREPARAKHAES